MKKVSALLIFIFVLGIEMTGWTQEKFSYDSLEVSEARWSLLKKTGGFLGGLVTGFVFHELGHETMARFDGANITWSAGSDYIKGTTHNYSEASLRRIELAGFGAQIISTETLLFFEGIPKDNAFVLGWLGYNVISTFTYILSDQLLSPDGVGDFKSLRTQAGVSRGDVNLLQLGLVAHAALTTYRVFKNPKIKPYISATGREIVIGVGWSW